MQKKLKVVLCWHMHQPIYYEGKTQQYQLPWTYLHGIKDYVDMAAHLEAIPEARAVVNFTPTLLEQLDDYAQQINAYLQDATPIRDPLLAALNENNFTSKRSTLIEQCLRINKERIIERFAPFKQLAELAHSITTTPKLIDYINDQYFIDLLMWYHLGWLAETVRLNDKRVQALIEKGEAFTDTDRRQLLEIIGELLSGIIPRYKALAERGQIELSFTPYSHPIIPLMLNMFSAREALPDINLSGINCYPDGKDRVRWHIREGIKVFEQYFGFKPHGCWPSEGSISNATIRLMDEFNIPWLATGESVLRNSLNEAQRTDESIHRPYSLRNNSVACFFRDDNLSDDIGFEFGKWHGDDAVTNFVQNLENIAKAAPETGAEVVSIILDGENAWEYYPNNAYYFLSALYKQLSEHPDLELTTFSDCLTEERITLPSFVAGSWVYGNFTTWIGSKDKNLGWQMLMDAKHVFDRVHPCLEPAQQEAASRQLAICEGSDWCWWFGDYNPSSTVDDFDKLYRSHLIHLYDLLGETPPDYLHHGFTHGGGDPAVGGTMRKGQETCE
jgi:alpha-amylase/alpha-mannosidase (GH57 family)